VSILVRYTQSREAPRLQGPSQIFEVAIAVEVISATGVSVDSASAQGTATLIASPVGRCVAGASTQGVATLIASPVGTSIAGASTQGIAAKIAAVSGTCVGGSLAQGTAAQIAFPSGRSVAGALTYGTALHIGIPIGSSAAGTFTFGTASQSIVISASGVCAAGSSAQGAAAATAIPIGHSIAGSSTQGTTAVTAIPIGSSVAGASTFGTATSTDEVSPIGRCVAGGSTQGTAAVTAIAIGASVAGSLTYGAASEPAAYSPVGVCAAGSSAQGGARTVDRIWALMEAADFFVGPLMNELLACLCEQSSLAANPPAICCFRIGTEVVHDAGINTDQCCEGIAYVMLGDTWPSSGSFPEQDIVRQADAKCGPPTWAQSFKLGLIRCAPVGGLNAIACNDWNESAVQNVIDSSTLRNTACCFRDFIVANNSKFLGMSVVIERQIQGNPLGGCVERSLTLVAQIPNECEC